MTRINPAARHFFTIYPPMCLGSETHVDTTWWFEEASMNLKDKTALVTGGSSGIGLAIAKVFRDAGIRTAITGRDEERLNSAAASIGVHPIRADVANEADVERTMTEVLNAFGNLDILVN